jgi:hypothetical protein
MNKLIGSDIGDYGFIPLEKKIVLTGLPIISLEQVILITNVTTGNVIYNFSSVTLGGDILDNILTLDYDTTTMNTSDRLQIIVNIPEDGDGLEVEAINRLTDKLSNADTALVMWGEKGPVAQNERENSSADVVNEVLTYDTNMARLFGTNPLVTADKRIPVETAPLADVRAEGMLRSIGDTVQVSLKGHNTVLFYGQGNISCTIVYECSIEGSVWTAVSIESITASNTFVIPAVSTTGTGLQLAIYRVMVTGYSYFRARVSTAPPSGTFSKIIISASYGMHSQKFVGAVGSSFIPLQQRTTIGDTAVYATSLSNDALTPPEFNPRGIYYAGECVQFNGVQWQALAYIDANAAGTGQPWFNSNWRIDPRPKRSLVTNKTVSSPDDTRLRTESEFEDYQMRLAEESMLLNKASRLDAMLLAERTALSQDLNLGFGQSGMSAYTFEEVR